MDDRTDDCAFGAMMSLALRRKFRKLRFQMIADIFWVFDVGMGESVRFSNSLETGCKSYICRLRISVSDSVFGKMILNAAHRLRRNHDLLGMEPRVFLC